jgi:hypothetical protein
MLSKTKLPFPLQSFSAPFFRHQPRPSIIASTSFIGQFITMFVGQFTTWFPLLLVAAVQRMAAQNAVALARDLALVRHQIEIDVLGRAKLPELLRSRR